MHPVIEKALSSYQHLIESVNDWHKWSKFTAKGNALSEAVEQFNYIELLKIIRRDGNNVMNLHMDLTETVEFINKAVEVITLSTNGLSLKYAEAEQFNTDDSTASLNMNAVYNKENRSPLEVGFSFFFEGALFTPASMEKNEHSQLRIQVFVQSGDLDYEGGVEVDLTDAELISVFSENVLMKLQDAFILMAGKCFDPLNQPSHSNLLTQHPIAVGVAKSAPIVAIVTNGWPELTHETDRAFKSGMQEWIDKNAVTTTGKTISPMHLFFTYLRDDKILHTPGSLQNFIELTERYSKGHVINDVVKMIYAWDSIDDFDRHIYPQLTPQIKTLCKWQEFERVDGLESPAVRAELLKLKQGSDCVADIKLPTISI